METRAMQPAPFASTGVKLIVGLFVTAVGVLLTLDNLDIIHSDRYLEWWPLLLIAIGILKLLGNGNRIISIILIVAGAWLIAYNLELIRFTIFDLWPLILIGIGLSFVARAIGFRPEKVLDHTGVQSGQQSEVWAVFSSRVIDETARDFTGRRYVALLGGCEIDLTGADIAKSPAVIETYAFWGGIEIRVPEGWEIVGEVVPVMGGFEVKVRPSASTGKQLIVRGAAVMGGVEIKSSPRRMS
jgi:predicted membrane protein